jgi:hypothetical protein
MVELDIFRIDFLANNVTPCKFFCEVIHKTQLNEVMAYQSSEKCGTKIGFWEIETGDIG